MIRVLMVCTGNICRSPLAEGLLRLRLQEVGLQSHVDVDSAGVIGYHSGQPPDPRARSAAHRRGFSIEDLRAREIKASDLAISDHVVAMDQGHLAHLQRLAQSPEQRAKCRLMLSFAPQLPSDEVPDPYYGSWRDFERVLDLLEMATDGLLAHLRQSHRALP